MIRIGGSGTTQEDARRPLLIGLSGPIGCGKSTVAAMLGDVGGTVIDADALAREATRPGSAALPEIRARFGERVFNADATLNRAELAAIVFDDSTALADLEAIIHPRVRALVEERLEGARREGAPFAVVEAIKLVEGGLAERCDEVWLIDCDATTQRARLAGRGVAPDDIDRRLATQGADLTRRLAAQLEGRQRLRIIDTGGSLEATREVVEDTLAEVLDSPLT